MGVAQRAWACGRGEHAFSQAVPRVLKVSRVCRTLGTPVACPLLIHVVLVGGYQGLLAQTRDLINLLRALSALSSVS